MPEVTMTNMRHGSLAAFMALLFAVACAASIASEEGAPTSDGPKMGYPDRQKGASEDPSLGVKAFDLFLSRPTTLVASLLGTVGWTAALPFTATGLATTSVGDARKAMVDYPFKYTFTRPLGDFSERQQQVVEPPGMRSTQVSEALPRP
jgi:hypothetical protein